MRKFVSITAGSLAILVALGFAFFSYRHARYLKLDTPYQTVLLDNGQVFFGKLSNLDTQFPVMTEVYYIQHQVNTQTKEEKNILIRRGNEWHAPNRTVLNVTHIVMVEPVSQGSQVAKLIAEFKTKSQ